MITGKDDGRKGGRRRREEGKMKKKKGNKNGNEVNRESQTVMELHFRLIY